MLQLIGGDVKLTVAVINIAWIIVSHKLVIGRWIRITVSGDLLQMAVELVRVDALSYTTSVAYEASLSAI